jgi:hypothetical protein
MGNLAQKLGDSVLETSGHYMTPDPLVPDEAGTFGRVTHGFLGPFETIDQRFEANGITDLEVEPKAGIKRTDSDLASRGTAREFQAVRCNWGRKGHE